MRAALFCLSFALWPVWALSTELTPRDVGALTRDLSRPGSAVFRNVRTAPKIPQFVCGEMNWRAENGEYVGFKGFWIEPFEGQYAIESQNPVYAIRAQTFGC